MEYKNQKLTERREKRRMNASRGIGGWLAAVIALSCVCLVLTTVVIHDKFMSGGGEAMLSNVYARSFYDLMGCIDNIDVNLNKLTVANGNKNKQRILGDVIVQANLAEASLETLPIEQRSVHSTAKFINQVGDFSKYLNNKLINGESISEEDLSTLKSMQKINSELRVKLKNLAGELGDDFDFMTLLSGEENMMIEYFNELEYRKAFAELRAVWVEGNNYISEAEPWVVIKENPTKAAMILRTCINLIKIFAILSMPIMPKVAENMLAKLNIKIDTFGILKGFDVKKEIESIKAGAPFEVGDMLFERITPERVEELKAKYGSSK